MINKILNDFKTILLATILLTFFLSVNGCDDSYGIDSNVRKTLIPHDTVTVTDTVLKRDTLYFTRDSLIIDTVKVPGAILPDEFYVQIEDYIWMANDSGPITNRLRYFSGLFNVLIDTTNPELSVSMHFDIKRVPDPNQLNEPGLHRFAFHVEDWQFTTSPQKYLPGVAFKQNNWSYLIIQMKDNNGTFEPVSYDGLQTHSKLDYQNLSRTSDGRWKLSLIYTAESPDTLNYKYFDIRANITIVYNR
jgi:hypothetical protein